MKRLRDAIRDAPARLSARRRRPEAVDADHPLIEDLKGKSYTTGRQLSEREACAPGFADAFAKLCKETSPLMSFLADSVGARF